MKTTKICYVLFALFLTACHKDDGPTSPDPQKSSAKQITGFVFKAADNATFVYDIIATIDQNGRTITANVPNGTDVTAIVPEISVSEKAAVSPAGAANFTNPVGYTVTAQDGTKTVYSASVSIAPSSEKQILSFRFEGIESEGVTVDISAEIDEENKTITATMPSGTDITALEPVVEISPGTILEPEGPQEFTEPINYTVTAEDGSINIYLVTLKVVLTEKEILLLIAKENPGNTLESWNEANGLEDFNGVTTDNNGKVIKVITQRKGLTVLPSQVGQLVNLEILDLGENMLEAVPPEIGQLVNLQGLWLRNNELVSIPPEIGQLSHLELLSLSTNKLESLPTEIVQLSNLESLSLSNNELTSVPSEIVQLTSLTRLYLESNALVSIPTEIGQLSNLELLFLYDNKLESLPPEIGQLSNLELLFLYDNNLENLPPEIGQLSKLTSLALENNALAAVPSEIGQLTQLEELRLDGNGLTEIPKAVCDLDIFRGGNTKVDIVPGVKCLGDRTSSN